ncbi:cytochrome P450 [Sphingomonas sp. RP10(2022)]|uniref:Bifunctional cytochrome P450/NADPH--P450 reductase n=1 Tax=Sphingomonas liriopis TaxID=2949094 RepID=A0A9X2KNU5_9SPHN|nr:cytochrome P450 [Sphingomonas liriopis]MCP3734019.1 cytochrome P450 [Sphingomonas liriopis]
MSSSFPKPPTIPVLGHLLMVDADAPTQSVADIAMKQGPVFELQMLDQRMIIVTGQTLVDELCDERRFGKLVHNALRRLRPAVGDGLFTADGDDPNWTLAHRILMPAFGPLGIQEMLGKMLDIAGQMFDRWDRFGEGTEIDVADAMTRLTLDTLALCAFDFRFNSFYRDEMHPFIGGMVGALLEAAAQERRPDFVTRAMIPTRRRFERDIAVMHELADTLLAQRRREDMVGTRGDLLDTMLIGTNPQTGERLSDENIRFQLVTFLIAGHETTSGLLSFAVHLLLKNPAVLEEARAVVDATLGTRTPTIDDLARMRFIEQVLMETLRLWPTAPAFAVTPHEPTTLGGIYPVVPGDELMVILPALHRDPTVWGSDAEAFRPERFADGAAAALPPNAWKPFGNGQRACIGRGFAMQEAQLVLAMMLQRFDIIAADDDYALKVVETLTMKPEGLRIRVRPRLRRDQILPAAADRAVSAASAAGAEAPDAGDGTGKGADVPLMVLHGGNSGTCAAFARRIAAEGAQAGYAVTTASLDAGVDALAGQAAVVVVTASYEGQPPDNARRFVAWLDALAPASLSTVPFAVLGCGNRQWARTYQAVPIHIDRALAAAGAERMIERGACDAAGDLNGAASAWMEALWTEMGQRFGKAAPTAIAAVPLIRLLPPAAGAAYPDFGTAICIRNSRMADGAEDGRSAKREIVLDLPEGVAYRAGDHLAVMPRNPPELVRRALKRLGLDAESRVVLEDGRGAVLPIGENDVVTAETLFARLVELEKPVTREQIGVLLGHTSCPPERRRLEALLNGPTYETEVIAARRDIVTLLEALPSCTVDLAALLGVLSPMAPRRYSIASSPLVDPRRCSLTISVLDAPAHEGPGRHRGLASNYLATREAGDRIDVRLVSGTDAFRLPVDPRVPIVMIAAGSGIAPFRGFIEERHARKAAGEAVGRTLLFFGCRHPEVDLLHDAELTAWSEQGIVERRNAFSRCDGYGARYVQDALLRDRDDIVELMAAGGHLYVCGSADTLVPAVEHALVAIAAAALNRDEATTRRWLSRSIAGSGRYGVDAFA